MVKRVAEGFMLAELLESRRLMSISPAPELKLANDSLPAGLDGRVGASGGGVVFAPHSTVAGATQGEWSARWWQWAVSIPAANNPLLDATGADAAEGQSGPVYFLAGAFSTDPIVRNIQIPTGKHVFFPLVNAFYVPSPGDPPITVQEERDFIAAFINTTSSLTARIDGQDVGQLFSHREVDPNTFAMTLPADNLFGVDPGVYAPAVSDGYWLMLSPFSKGQHTIQFTARVDQGTADPSDDFTQDITYNIDVVPRGQLNNQIGPSIRSPRLFGSGQVSGEHALDLLTEPAEMAA